MFFFCGFLALLFRGCGNWPFSWLVVSLPILLGARFSPSFLWLGSPGVNPLFFLLRFATPSAGGTSFLGWDCPSCGVVAPSLSSWGLSFWLSSAVWCWGPSGGSVLLVVGVGLSFSGWDLALPSCCAVRHSFFGCEVGSSWGWGWHLLPSCAWRGSYSKVALSLSGWGLAFPC